MRFSGWCASRPGDAARHRSHPRQGCERGVRDLKFNKKLAAKQIAKTLKSAVANAEQKALKDNEASTPTPCS